MKQIRIRKKNLKHLWTYRRNLYGPLFFRHRLTDSQHVSTDDISFEIVLENYKDKNRLKERYQKLVRTIAQRIVSAGPEGEMIEISDMSMNVPLIIIRLVLAVTIAVVVIAYLLLTYVF